MLKNIRSEIQIVLVIIFAAIALMALSIVIGGNAVYNTASAQGPVTPPVSFTPAPLEDFGLSPDEINAIDKGLLEANATYDLVIEKTTEFTTVTPGSAVTYTITITNDGTNDTDNADYVRFQDIPPTVLTDIHYIFPPGLGQVDNGETEPYKQWMIPVLTANQTIVITVTGVLTSDRAVRATNTAVVYPFGVDTDSDNNSSSADIDIAGEGLSSGLIFLPLVSKFPTPTPVPVKYEDDFSDDNSGWWDGSTNDCEADYNNDQYVTKADEDEECYFPAPSGAEFEYGKAEVTARRSDGNDEFTYGIYINGRGGGIYYFLRIEFDGDDCWWKLRKNTTNVVTGGCNSQSNGYRNTNKLALEHIDNGGDNGTINVYMNDNLLGSYADSNQLDGVGTGLYIRAKDGDNVTVKFDDFTVYYP